MADETETAGLLLPETGTADVGILAATDSNGTSTNENDDGIGENQGDSSAATNNNDGIQKLEDESCSDDDDDMDDEEEEEEEDARPTTRWDVFQALKQVTIPGNFCAGGCADGSTTITPSLPTTLGLRVTSGKSKSKAASNSASTTTTSIGSISLPITDTHVQQLRTMSSKVDDESYHNVRQVDPECIKITNPSWDASLTKLLRTASLQLGVNPGHVRAELDMMLLLQRGSCIDRCRNADEDDNVLGTLMIQLPSIFTGGEIRIWDNNDNEENDDDEHSNGNHAESSDDDGDDGLIQTFDLGSGARSTAPYSCHYLCHYSDCDYEMKKVKSGTRLMLLYSLIYEGRGGKLKLKPKRKPNAHRRRLGMAPLERSLEMLPCVDRILAVPLAKQYSLPSLLLEGVDALKVSHRGKVEAIRVAGKLGWRLMVVNATRVRTDTTSSYYGSRSTTSSSVKSSIREMFDENGKELASSDKKWLGESGLISFEPCEGSGRGMVLAYKPDKKKRRYINSLWGKSETSVKEQESDRFYGFDECTTIHKKTYSSSFIIAYDESCEFELKCLRGRRDVIENAVEAVTSSKDLDLLFRFESVLESRNEIMLSHDCAAKLVNLLVVADGSAIDKKLRILLIRMFLERCYSGYAPTASFFESTKSAIESVGWASVYETVSSVLEKDDRRGLSPCQLLIRIEFLHSLSTSNLVPQSTVNALAENCFSNYKSSSRRRADSVSRVSKFLHALIGRVGWAELVKKATEAYIEVMLEGYRSSYSFGIVDQTASLAELLLGFESSGGAPSMKHHLEIFVSDFVSKLGEKDDNGKFKTSYQHSTHNYKLLAEVASLVLDYGTDGDCNIFGEWITHEPCRFTNLLSSLIVGTSNEDLPLKILNHFVVQQKSSGKDWINHPTMGKDECSPPSSTRHIEQMLNKFPAIAQAVDTNGRIPLHYAVASEKCSFDSIKLLFEAHPKGASIVDPVTGMHPFMLAGASRNMDAAFNLLLADPSLVGGALAEEGKKRKRSPSMD